ncbi:MAG TPA: carboxypeptidase-like regulatory domain-containing protein, partial [Vicinamibacterales bacterium]|nr:carboxypeptidase-like regulatory domain-containing protein [Vicinamibacterales bacterium]
MRVLAPLLFVCALAVGVAASVQTTASISGTVVDPAGSPVPGVTLELVRGAAVQQRTTSDGAGAWKFEKVSRGEYEIRARLAGFATSVAKVSVGTSDIVTLRIPMKIGAQGETVAVTAGSPATESARVIVGAAAAPPAPPPPAGERAALLRDGLVSRDLHEIQRPETATYAGITENRFR